MVQIIDARVSAHRAGDSLVACGVAMTRDDPNRWLIYPWQNRPDVFAVEYCAWGTGDGFIAFAPTYAEAVKKMEDEIQGGEKRYTHQQYALGVVIAKDMIDARYNKKPWVPQWLFNWFATPDLIDLMDRKMRVK